MLNLWKDLFLLEAVLIDPVQVEAKKNKIYI